MPSIIRFLTSRSNHYDAAPQFDASPIGAQDLLKQSPFHHSYCTLLETV